RGRGRGGVEAMNAEMACSECSNLLLEYVAGRLEPAERERVERHLATCDRCRREARLWRATRAEIAINEGAIPPDRHADDGWARRAGRLGFPPRLGGNATQPPVGITVKGAHRMN